MKLWHSCFREVKLNPSPLYSLVFQREIALNGVPCSFLVVSIYVVHMINDKDIDRRLYDPIRGHFRFVVFLCILTA